MAEAFRAEGLIASLGVPDAVPAGQLLLAFSGGLDSTVLLHALVQLRDAGALGGHRLEAFHVNHGLHADAGHWEVFCRQRAAMLRVPFTSRRLALAPASGESEEEVAREARYAALLSHLEPGGRLLTAHHADDQLETVLLALARGAGPAGLAAMPPVMPRGRGWHLRPLIEYTRAALHDYAEAHALPWLEDPANRQDRFARSFLRQQVVPVLRRRWPGIGASASRSARLCADAERLNAQLAQADLGVPGTASNAGMARTLEVARLVGLEPQRVANALRYWIRSHGHPMPPERRLRTAAANLLGATASGEACVRWNGTELRRYRDRLYLLAPLPTAGGEPRPLGGSRSAVLPAGLGRVALIAAERSTPPERRLSATALAAGELSLGFRSGGERVRLPGRAGTRQLKRLLQEWAVVPWMRERLPLLRVGGEIAAIADLTVTAPFAARLEEPALRLCWQQHPPIH
jgi:tRNA(Ile)-lysidine synthase